MSKVDTRDDRIAPMDGGSVDRSSGRGGEAGAEETGPGAPVAGDAHARLDLMLPDDLPAEVSLDRAEAVRIRTLLCALLETLELDHGERVGRIDALLARLEEEGRAAPRITADGLPLTPFQISDYDRYFRVTRVAADRPARALVRSLLQTTRAISDLFARGEQLSDKCVREQMDGIRVHADLLARTFNLERLR